MTAPAADRIIDRLRASRSVPDSFSLRCQRTVDSTNREVKKALSAGEPEGYTVVASEQKGGYGRQGRSWNSPVGGVYLSCALRPLSHGVSPKRLSTLSLVLSVALRRCLRRFASTEKIRIKWPNDIVYVRGETLGKIGGISVEVIDEAVCVGIGINVFYPEKEPAIGGKYTPVFVADLVDEWKDDACVFKEELTERQSLYMEELITVLLSEVYGVYNQWLVEGFTPFRDEFQTGASLLGQTVQVVSLSHDVMHEGVVCDIDQDGLLCLKDKQGAIIRVHSGEVHLK